MIQNVLFIIVVVSGFTFGDPLRSDESSRIVNGAIAANLQFPYVASLQELGAPQLTTTRGHSCSGVLITYQHILTAASCMYTYNNLLGTYTIKNAANYRVFAGASSLTNDTSTDRIRAIANFTHHPEYIGPPSHVNDIGIITLLVPFANTTVTPLPVSTAVPRDYDDCTVAGWGSATQLGLAASTNLLYTNKYIYNQELCANVINPQLGTPNILPTMLCAATYNTQITSCTNDTGNALVCNGDLAGVLTWYPGCQVTTYPEVYTRVANYTTWIRGVTGDANLAKPAFTVMLSSILFQMITSLLIS